MSDKIDLDEFYKCTLRASPRASRAGPNVVAIDARTERFNDRIFSLRRIRELALDCITAIEKGSGIFESGPHADPDRCRRNIARLKRCIEQNDALEAQLIRKRQRRRSAQSQGAQGKAEIVRLDPSPSK